VDHHSISRKLYKFFCRGSNAEKRSREYYFNRILILAAFLADVLPSQLRIPLDEPVRWILFLIILYMIFYYSILGILKIVCRLTSNFFSEDTLKTNRQDWPIYVLIYYTSFTVLTFLTINYLLLSLSQLLIPLGFGDSNHILEMSLETLSIVTMVCIFLAVAVREYFFEIIMLLGLDGLYIWVEENVFVKKEEEEEEEDN